MPVLGKGGETSTSFPRAVVLRAAGSCMQHLHCPLPWAGVEEQTATASCAAELPSTHLLRDEIFPEQHLAGLGGEESKVRMVARRETPADAVYARVMLYPTPCWCVSPLLGWGHLVGTPSPLTMVSPGPPDPHSPPEKSSEGRAHGARGCWEAEHPVLAGLALLSLTPQVRCCWRVLPRSSLGRRTAWWLLRRL